MGGGEAAQHQGLQAGFVPAAVIPGQTFGKEAKAAG